jgi:hypothetical protein
MDDTGAPWCEPPIIPPGMPCAGAIARISHANHAIARKDGKRSTWRGERFTGTA